MHVNLPFFAPDVGVDVVGIGAVDRGTHHHTLV